MFNFLVSKRLSTLKNFAAFFISSILISDIVFSETRPLLGLAGIKLRFTPLLGLILSCVVMLGYQIPKGAWGVYGLGFAVIGILLAIFKKDKKKE